MKPPKGGWNGEPDKRSRLEQYGEGHPYTCNPECEGVEYVQDLFYELGPVKSGEVRKPVEWQDINHYDAALGLNLSAWEKSTLMAMSRSFVQWLNKGSSQGALPGDGEVPYILDTAETRAQAGRNMAEASKRGRDKMDDALNTNAG